MKANGATARKRECGEVRRQQIAAAALRIISGRGLHKLTAAELAREVGIADGTIFRHFRDKAEIVAMAVGYLEQLLGHDFPPATLSPLARLESFVLGRLRLIQAEPDLCALAFSDRLLEAGSEHGLAPLGELMRRTRLFVEECLRTAQADGTIDPRLRARTLALMIIGAIQSAATVYTLEPGRQEDPPEAVWQTLKTLLCRFAQVGPLQERRVEG
jgi:AcrR family transcriptional regulator